MGGISKVNKTTESWRMEGGRWVISPDYQICSTHPKSHEIYIGHNLRQKETSRE